MTSTPRSSTELINRAAEDVKKIQDAVEFWTRMQRVKFSERYHDALLASGIEPNKAAEIAAVVRELISNIGGDLENARYRLNELTGQVDDAARRSRGVVGPPGSFRV